MTVLHFVTHLFPPAHGGLELWTLRIAQSLARTGVRPLVHIRAPRDEFDYGDMREFEGVEIRPLARTREVLEEPLIRSNWPRLKAERWRLDHLLLRNTIREEMRREPGRRHVVVSSYITAEGFLASTVSSDLGLPHIVCAVGTDYSRDYREPHGRLIAGHVLRNAAAVVTMNEEQERAFRRDLGIDNVRTIRPSASEQMMAYRWSRAHDGTVRLFSDTGFSFKKATQVLLAAFARLRAEAVPVTLAIWGDIHAGQEDYWRATKAAWQERFADAVEFRDHADVTEVWQRLTASDIYCSATLGEGCSLARSAAMCVGIPVVTTRCGEAADMAEGASHVRLCDPGDPDGFHEALKQACADVFAGTMHVDTERVAQWRAEFDVSRERELWVRVLSDVLA